MKNVYWFLRYFGNRQTNIQTERQKDAGKTLSPAQLGAINIKKKKAKIIHILFIITKQLLLLYFRPDHDIYIFI